MTPHWDQSDDKATNLSPEDQVVLDALVEVGFDRSQIEGLSAEQKRRLDRVQGLMHVLEAYPVGEDDLVDQATLVDAALARIDQYEQQRSSRMSVGMLTEEQGSNRGQRRIRLPDFVALAAVLLIIASITLPILNQMSEQSAHTTCTNNLASIGSGFSLFADDNEGVMPNVMQAGIGGGWGQFSNTRNLEPLTDGNYCADGHFNCPGSHDHSVSYSYQMQEPGQMMRLATGRATIILADKNPVIEALRENRRASAMELSANHRAQGRQNTLWSDGSCRQLYELPVFEHDGFHDNIWLPQGIGTENLAPDANSVTDLDVFLAH